MAITTKTGDKGETSLIGGQRVSKASLRVFTYGDIDELSSQIGLAIAYASEAAELVEELQHIQNDLFALAADLATPQATSYRIQAHHVEYLDRALQKLNASVPPQRQFILPGGCLSAAQLHVCRAVCRRAERQAVALYQSEPGNSEALIYLNRLSDYLFLAARAANQAHNRADIPAVLER